MLRWASFSKELEQRAVDLIGVCPRDVVRAALHRDEPDVLDQAGEPFGGGPDRENPAIGAVHDQRRDIDSRQIAVEIREPGSGARVHRVRRRAGGDSEARQPCLVADPGAPAPSSSNALWPPSTESSATTPTTPASAPPRETCREVQRANPTSCSFERWGLPQKRLVS